MSLFFKPKKTFNRAFKTIFFPMVMAAEPGKSGSELEETSDLSIPNKKGVPNIKTCTKSIPAESRNGVMAIQKQTSSVENNKYEGNSEISVDVLSQNGQTHDNVKEKFTSRVDSSNNNLKSDVSIYHRDQLLLLHLDLIERQQKLIQEKDKEILELKNEKEQVWQQFFMYVYFVVKNIAYSSTVSENSKDNTGGDVIFV